MYKKVYFKNINKLINKINYYIKNINIIIDIYEL